MEKQVTALVGMDFSTAFDTVDHDIMLDVLNTRFGIDVKAFEWYASYLSPRHLKVNVSQDYSNFKDLTFSIPQGSCTRTITAYLDYANTVFVDLSNVEFAQLQHVQNMTAKVVTGAIKYDNSTHALKELHWLPVKLRALYKILTMVFQYLEGNAPDYLTCLIKERSIRPHELRSKDEPRLLCVPFVKKHTFAVCAFSVAGLTEWNNLPDYLRVNIERPRFRKLLKTYLFGCF